MKRFYVIAGRGLSLIAALFMALSPIFHGLHLVSCKHEHAPLVYCCCSGDEHDSNGSGNFRSLINDSPNQENQGHDPSTCPICQTFTQLMQGAQITPPPDTLTPSETCFLVLYSDRDNPGIFRFSIGFPRAPPAG